MKRIGVLGGGQLGMMLQEAVSDMDLSLSFLDPDPNCSCIAVSDAVTKGSFKDTRTVLDFGADKDIITVEIEHVDIAALKTLQSRGVEVYPQPDILAMIQDKGAQKEFYKNHDFPTAPFELLESSREVDFEQWQLPFVLKLRTEGYDGHGVKVVKSEKEVGIAFSEACLVEEMADIEKDLCDRGSKYEGDIKSFPAVEMEFDPEANLVSALIGPADIPLVVAEKAEAMAKRLIEELGLVGILAVEFFWLKDGRIWVNEVAPRPHNSGHQTIEGNKTSQYEQHLRAITGMPLGDTDSKGVAVMVNLLGSPGHNGPRKIIGTESVENITGVFLHDYHKSITRPKRKMGHITVVGQDRDQALHIALELQKTVQYVSTV